ncbi:MAG: PD-(D/E)XK nuclease family protein [Burkholderiaceae bacterium]
MQQLRAAVAQRGIHPAGVVVLLPYVQLIGMARSAWARISVGAAGGLAGFVPRFESTMNWSRSLTGFVPSQDDMRRDVARDIVTAQALLARAGMRRQQDDLAAALMQAAWSVAPLAACVQPAQRSAWGARTMAALDAQPLAPALDWEAQIGRIAVAWAANSAYPTDALFSARCDLLVLVEGLQEDPLQDQLRVLWSDRVLQLRLQPPTAHGVVALYRAADPEAEAEQAAACVLVHLAQGRSPVALVAQDRLLTRRTRALLAEHGVTVRDETGWTLSTTRAAAAMMGLLRAMAWDASTDAVLDWSRQAPVLDPAALAQLEADLRRAGVRDWQAWSADDVASARINVWRQSMQGARALPAWLAALRSALQACGLWVRLLQDIAGQAVIDALHLQESADEVFADVERRISLGAFTGWVGQVLEAGSFVPPHPEHEQVIILPLSQLFGRAPAAVVLPGCDEGHLAASPELPASWTAAQREALGLPSRERLALALADAWQHALGAPRIDILWRASDGGETVMPSIFVQQLRQTYRQLADDPRTPRQLLPQACTLPQPQARVLPLSQLSASGYEDLRRCPYRFFALRQLGLRESDELDAELGKRDFGNWLHLLLSHFHHALAETPGADRANRISMIDAAAARASRDLALAENEFLPFAASWPQVRSAYLQWLSAHEAKGARFQAAEDRHEMPLGDLTLVGRIDRIDRAANGVRQVIDYKTESREKTNQRIRQPMEDSQLAFYAALLEDDTLEAMYLHIAESGPAKAFVQPDIVSLRDQLVEAIRHDMVRIAAGAPLPALGVGAACDYCAARGLCRRDFWSPVEQPVVAAFDG